MFRVERVKRIINQTVVLIEKNLLNELRYSLNTDGEIGYLIKQCDLNQLLNKILFLYENKNKRKTFRQNRYNRVLEKFTWKIIIKDYMNLLKKVLTT